MVIFVTMVSLHVVAVEVLMMLHVFPLGLLPL